MNSKTEMKFILRRVGFAVIAVLLVIILMIIVFSNKKDKSNNSSFVQKTPENTESIGVFNPITTPIPTQKLKPEKRSILIYHTHNDEAYYKGSKKYVESDTGRSFDENYNIISVGNALKNNLESRNFNVIHDKSDSVSAGFYSAYDTSYQNIKNYIGKVDIFIDLHRDAYYNTKQNYLKKNSKEYAYIRMVVANGTNYDNKPNYTENLKFAEALDERLNNILPGISKGIFIKEARLNQHISNFCLLIEIGNEKNDIEQARNSTEIIAQALNDIFY